MDSKLQRKKVAGAGDSAGKSHESQNMMVAVRIRPLSSKELCAGHSPCCSVIGGNTVAIKKEGNAAMYLKSQQGSLNEYCFDAAFDSSSSQRDIYEQTTKKFIPNVIEGYNVTVFAYGATGAGKTHTMMGNTRHDNASENVEAGIIPNALSDVFSLIGSRKMSSAFGETWNVFVSFMEVYNEQVYDLLESTGKVLSVREDQERGVVVVAGLTEQKVDCADSVLALLQQGNRNRKTEATMANQVSSRSHAVMQLIVRHGTRSATGQEITSESTLSMIDLAGSERASATANRGSRLQEGANINKSLLALANCINALALNTGTAKRMNVKYRDSKLTHLLKSSLEGKCNLIMIANINPSDMTFEDSHNTLKYANRAKNIKVNPVVETQVKEGNWMEREAHLRAENSMLKSRIDEMQLIIQALQKENSELKANRGAIQFPANLTGPQRALNMELTTLDDDADDRCPSPLCISRIDNVEDSVFQEAEEVACTDIQLDESIALQDAHVDDELAIVSKLASTRRRHMDKVLRRRQSMESSDDLIGPVELPPLSSVDDSWRCDFESDEEEREISSAPVTRENHRSAANTADMSLKSRVAALAKITQEQQIMFDAILRDTGTRQTLRQKSHGNRRASTGASTNFKRPDSPDKLSTSIEPAAIDHITGAADESMPSMNSSLEIKSMRARPITSKEKKDVKVHVATRSKRLLVAAEEENSSVIQIFDENIQDRPASKKRRNSLIPMKASSKSNEVLGDKINIVDSVERMDGSMKKQLVPIEKKKPMTRLARMSLVASRNASENTQVTENAISMPESQEASDIAPRRGTRTTRRSVAAKPAPRRLAGRDL